MTQFNKLVDRILALPAEAEFRDVRRLLEAYGWTLVRVTGSHHHFGKQGERTLSIPVIRGRRVKRVYLKQIISALRLDE